MTCNQTPRIAVAVLTQTGGAAYVLMDTPGNAAQLITLLNQASDAQARDLGRAHELRVTVDDSSFDWPTTPRVTPEEALLVRARRLAPADALFVETRDVTHVDSEEDPHWVGTVLWVHAPKTGA